MFCLLFGSSLEACSSSMSEKGPILHSQVEAPGGRGVRKKDGAGGFLKHRWVVKVSSAEVQLCFVCLFSACFFFLHGEANSILYIVETVFVCFCEFFLCVFQ